MSDEKGSWLSTFMKGYKVVDKYAPDKVKFFGSGQISFIREHCGKKIWMFRLDVPHKGVPHNHLNVNKRYFNLKNDPHQWLPSSTNAVVAPIVKGAQKAWVVADYVRTAGIISMIGRSVSDDVKYRSTRNTSETLSKLGGVTLSNMAVIKIGSFAAMLLVGGFAPAFLPLLLVPASVYGTVKLSDYIDSKIERSFDWWQFGMREKRCGKCLRFGSFRAYRGETHVCKNAFCNFSHVYKFACRM